MATYSFKEQFELGNQPTWDTPDIFTNSWNPMRLYDSTKVTVRNLSADASAVATQVRVSLSRFGMGFPRSPIGTQTVTLAPLQQADLYQPLPAAVLAGEQRIRVDVDLYHPHDARAINNRASQAHEAFYTSVSGRNIDVSFPVRNPRSVAQAINIGSYVSASGLSITFAGAGPVYAPLEERTLGARLSVAGSLVGGGGTEHRREATFVAYNQDGTVLDGLTFVVMVNS